MLAGCTQLSVTAVPSTSRINTPSIWSKPQHDAVHRQGRTPVGDGNIASRATVPASAADRDRRGRNDAANVERNRRTTLPTAAANRLGLDPGSVITVAG